VLATGVTTDNYVAVDVTADFALVSVSLFSATTPVGAVDLAETTSSFVTVSLFEVVLFGTF